MIKDEIIKMAREAGMPDPMVFIGAYERFAALVAASEREACVQICIEQACKYQYPSHAGAALTVCADAIRAQVNP